VTARERRDLLAQCHPLSLFPDGADLPLFTQPLAPTVPVLMAAADLGYPITSCEWIAAAGTLLDQLRPHYPSACDNAATEVARLDRERSRYMGHRTSQGRLADEAD
jgi:hypothetical protein